VTPNKNPEHWAWPSLHDAQRTVLLEVLFHGSRSRADLARRTGLSRTSLTRLTRDLVELGFVSEGEMALPNGRGRPSEMLDLRPESACFAGIKLTGDALYAAVIDLRLTANIAARVPNFRELRVCELRRIPKRRSSQNFYSTHSGE
jgi:DNA-binding Lrp family transcriptional regulator